MDFSYVYQQLVVRAISYLNCFKKTLKTFVVLVTK